MRTTLTFVICLLLSVASFAQDEEQEINSVFRSSLYTTKLGVSQLGGYAQIDYNQQLSSDTYNSGKLDVHRMILFVGHKFNERVSFFSEIEIEHVKEIFIEQAFLDVKINDWANLRSGLILIPMSIVNEYHEPPTFNGVERPNLNKAIVPTTWREIGTGFAGRVDPLSLNYQAYIVTGPLGFDGSAKLRGSDGLRKARQKGAASTMTHNPNYTAKVNYYGLPNLNLGASIYTGKTGSTLYDGILKSDNAAAQTADSSVVNITMLGADFRYKRSGFQARGEIISASLGNTDQYNAFTGSDLGSAMFGYYLEAGYNLFQTSNIEGELIPFARFEKYNTHHQTEGDLIANEAFDRTDITLGLSYKPDPRAVLKADFQLLDNKSLTKSASQLNLGVGVWF